MRYKCTIEYIGEKYSGMQKQQSTSNTIQEIIENAIFSMTQEIVEIVPAGRTDAGVSALNQVIHFDLVKNISTYQLMSGLNFYLKNEDISFKKIEEADSDFHARFSAIERSYKYFVNTAKYKPVHKKYTHFHFPYDINYNDMLTAKEFLIGKHDFSAFAKITESNKQNPIRTINSIEIERDEDELIFTISAQSFLHNMVRIITGTLLDVGIGKINPLNIKDILEKKARKLAGRTAPAHGLFFYKIKY